MGVYKPSDAHNMNLPWRLDDVNGTRQIVDCTGLPIALALGYTSLLKANPKTGE